MGIISYISASWELNGETECIHLNEFGFGSRIYSTLSWSDIDLTEVYNGVFIDNLEEIRYDGVQDYCIAVTPAECARVYCYMAAYIMAYKEDYSKNYADTWTGGSADDESAFHDKCIREQSENCSTFQEQYEKFKQAFSESPLTESELGLVVYLHDTLVFTKTLYEKSMVGAQNIKIAFMAS